MGVISGRVFDETGEPSAKVMVWAMQFGRYQGARKLIPFIVPEECCWRGSHALTDESGHYSVVLPPREFVVVAQSRETWPLESVTTQVLPFNVLSGNRRGKRSAAHKSGRGPGGQ
jgi:hypothetical protein